MNFLRKFVEYSIFISAIALVFLLTFEKYLLLPDLISWLGRWHPVILHFPIVLILVTIIQYWRKDEFFDWYLSVTALVSLLTAITGFLLSIENGSKGETTIIHQWLGVAVSLLMSIWYWISKNESSGNKISVIIQAALIILIITTGHFGGMITHGEDFLSWNKSDAERISALPDNPNIYQYFIQPILNQKCKSCHNENKAKGELILSNYSSLIQGGESGNIIDKNDWTKSALLHRIELAPDDEDHMPPKDEKQLTDVELSILHDWIVGGASDQTQFSDLDDGSKSHRLIEERIARSKDSQWNNLPEIADDQISGLASNYITVTRLFNRSNALQVIVYPNAGTVAGNLKTLKPIAENIIDLNISGLDLNQKDIQFINSMNNLEKLNLSHAAIDDGLFSQFEEFPALKELRINETILTDQVMEKMTKFPGLQKIFAHQSNISSEALHMFGEENQVFVMDDSPETAEFNSVLPVPTIENGRNFFNQPFKLMLRHPLKGIDIYYSLVHDNYSDQTLPFQKLVDSIFINANTKLKYYAEKEGWEASSIDSFNIFKSSLHPDHYELTHGPDSKYPGRGTGLLFDLEKGPDNFGDSAWMAFREDPFILNCAWEQETNLSSVTISTIVQTDPYLFPPQSIVVKGGPSRNAMEVLGAVSPSKLKERQEKYFDHISLKFEPSAIKFLQIEVLPLQSLPVWHQGKGQKGWTFIDEVILD